MSTEKDGKTLREFMKSNPAREPREREYFSFLDDALATAGVWPTTTTTTTTSTTVTTTTTV